MASDATRSKYVFLKTQLDPESCGLLDELKRRSPECSFVWAKHDYDPGNVHYHGVIRFSSTESWAWLRNWLQRPDHDPHSYSAAARSFQKCVRYLLHLDTPDKPAIPRSNLKFTGEIKESEIDMLLGRPRAYLLHDIQHAPFHDTFRLVSWLVSERGHGPGEVTAMLNCIMAVNKFVGPVSIMSNPQEVHDAFGNPDDYGIPDSSPEGEETEPGIDGLPDDDEGIPDDLW